MHNHDNKYPNRPGFEPGTSRLQALVDTNDPSVPDKIVYVHQWAHTLTKQYTGKHVESNAHLSRRYLDVKGDLSPLIWYEYICPYMG